MKKRLLNLSVLSFLLLASNQIGLAQSSLGTAFNYQGRLMNGTNAATGLYDFQFSLWNGDISGAQIGTTLARLAVPVTNGVFNVMLDFGSSVFTGQARWLEVAVRTNEAGSYALLLPRRELSPTPYALYAPNAGAAISADTAAIAGSATTLLGPLAGDVTGTQSATAVANVGGQGAASVASGAVAANAATDVNIPSTIVKRDTSGNFAAGAIAAGSLSGNGSGLIDLNASQLASGTVADSRLSGNVGLLDADQAFIGSNRFSGVLHATNENNFIQGSFAGNLAGNVTGDVIGNITGNVTGNVAGNATTATSAMGFTGPLAGDVTGTQGATVVASVGGQSAANVASGVGAANAATEANAPSTIVKRDANGNFATGAISGAFNGSFAGQLATLDVADNSAAGGQAVVRAHDFRIGSTDRHGTPGRALVDGGADFLYLNYPDSGSGPDWRHTLIGGTVVIDPTHSNDGALAGGCLKFGEPYWGTGIASKTTDGGNQFGLDLYTFNLPRLSITGDGRVGIGTTSPLTKLSLTGDGWWHGLSLQGGDGGVADGLFISSGRDHHWGFHSIHAEGSSNLVVQTKYDVPGRSLVLEPYAGNVGIGTSDPQTKLDVAGTIRATTFQGDGSGLLNLPSATWQVVSGVSQNAAPNQAYLLTNDALVTLTLPVSPAVGDIVRVSGSGAAGWKIGQNIGQTIWTVNLSQNLTPVAGSRTWYAVASSADGTKLVAAVYNDLIYTSNDSGLTWAPRGSYQSWYALASSADGSKLVAVVSGGYIYTSSDSGLTWAPQADSRDWRAVACSADGTKIIAAVNNGPVFISGDSGLTWTARVGYQEWVAVASSAAGSKLVAASSGQIYTSGDSGETWTPQPGGFANWSAVASSADGAKLVAGANGRIYTSSDSGVTWMPRGDVGQWHAVASSADGTKLVAADYGGLVYTSPDSGMTWTPRSSAWYWRAVSCSTDGAKIVAAVLGGSLYTLTLRTSVGASGYLMGGQYGGVELQYVGNGRWLPLSSKGNLSGF